MCQAWTSKQPDYQQFGGSGVILSDGKANHQVNRQGAQRACGVMCLAPKAAAALVQCVLRLLLC